MESRNILSIPQQIRNDVYLLSINPKMITFYGSYAIPNILYSGDIDAIEKVKGNYNTIAKSIQKVVKRILHTKNVYLGDFKAGLNHLYYNAFTQLGNIYNGKVQGYNKNSILNLIDQLLFTDEDRNELRNLISKPMTVTRWFDVDEILRKYYILRWNQQELSQGYKTVNNQKYTLADAIKDNTLTKIDTIQYVNNRLVEITNVFDITRRKDLADTEFTHSLKLNMLKYYFQKNYFKSLKRIFALSKLRKDNELIYKILPILNSELGLLYQVITDMKTIIFLIENFHSRIPWNHIINEIDFLKDRIVHITFSNKDKVFKLINQLVTLTNNENDREILLKALNNLVTQFSDILNKKAYFYMKKLKIIPLRRDFLP